MISTLGIHPFHGELKKDIALNAISFFHGKFVKNNQNPKNSDSGLFG